MINVILCGGNGTRLWPLSRTLYPKQFNKLISNQSLFQMTALRNQGVCDQTFIVSNEEQYFLALDHLEELNITADKFLLEPMGRNTAPAIALACFAAEEEELLLVTPSDHIVKNLDQYTACIKEAGQLAELGYLVTFGITPSYPETGFGYIESRGFDVISFKEKPDKQLAEHYLDQGNYFWNSGMFLFKAGMFLRELQKYAPDIYELSLEAFNHSKKKERIIRIGRDDMLAIPSDSIDFALMEKSENVKMIPSDIGWSDMGSFEALYTELPQDINKNTDNEQHIAVDSSRNLIISDERLIATIDIEDLIIIDTPDALLVSKQGSSQKVRTVVEKLKLRKSDLCDNHVTAYRPWGNHTVLDSTENYKIKKVIIKPGRKLSTQRHYHRNEHWIVVRGTALVSVNGNESLLRTNESTFIRMGEEHSVENPGKIDLCFIEVQVGDYVKEDDVIR
ncbi:mannose-1-phosphate guanylyltransferase/mannose-6-phosphate isomerase [Paenibacillus sp. P3E]|uniref:mannose-1-phosphate guanylyltransferase/mannose-6-phosphate isomerase n=1 Tax=Paenibacillus sp. P3E TaxID=1349435 RepID=UPI00093E8ED0|nr:mannose-1-phosphate guanylyltransferase/mannose-6-phosphate isomerase [Paenibacillus sp. P3E]OKP87116.1 mannose-1-phosphate guanylyltransferase/mannose-6-phosphate isomerase [Paenibacillus sp. P3E]